jgi:NADPH:quinone reductase-like Zn-dependent oxidoreductase
MDEGHGMVKEMSIPKLGRAIRYHEHGEPGEVLRMEELEVPNLSSGEVLIEMQATTIHPSDIGLINGSYGRLKEWGK